MYNEVEKIVSPVYMVGGSVRDIILGREPKDYDFTTPLTPDEIEAAAKAAGRRAYLIGKKFGTIGFKVAGPHGKFEYVEVTTFRSERYNPGSRKPEVEFVTDLKEDLSRRDFTINAIAYDGDKYIDPYGGRLHIMARKIKSVGEAKDRFKEDPLRMLRAARFAAQLDFEVDPNMIGKIRAMAHTIVTVSRERWVQELDKLLVSRNVMKGLDVLADTYLLRFMLPEFWVGDVHPNNALYLEMITNIVEAPKDADSKWAAMLLNIGKAYTAPKHIGLGDTIYPKHEIIGVELAKGICARLKFSNERTETVLEAVENQQIKST